MRILSTLVNILRLSDQRRLCSNSPNETVRKDLVISRTKVLPGFWWLKQRHCAASLSDVSEKKGTTAAWSPSRPKRPAGKWKSVSVMLSCIATVTLSDCRHIFDVTPSLHTIIWFKATIEIFQQSSSVLSAEVNPSWSKVCKLGRTTNHNFTFGPLGQIIFFHSLLPFKNICTNTLTQRCDACCINVSKENAQM